MSDSKNPQAPKTDSVSSSSVNSIPFAEVAPSHVETEMEKLQRIVREATTKVDQAKSVLDDFEEKIKRDKSKYEINMEAATDEIIITQLETKDYSYISLEALMQILEQFDRLGINILQVSRSATTLTLVHQNIKKLGEQHWMKNILEHHNLYQSELGQIVSQINTQNISAK